MTAPADRALLDRLEAAHYRVIGALYGCAAEPGEHGLRVRSAYVTDPDWNHLGRLRAQADPDAAAETLMAEAASLGRAGDRRPTLTVSPLTEPPGLAAALEARGWEVSYRFAWLIHPTRDADAEPDAATAGAETPTPAPELEIREVAAPDAAVFLDTFTRVFMPDDPASAAAYRAAVAASFEGDAPGVRVVHYLATWAGHPAGTASAVYADGVAGGFNLGVLPDFRRHGIAGALTARRRADARRAGNRHVYLLTEDPAVEALQLRRGHVKVMTTEGWSPPER